MTAINCLINHQVCSSSITPTRLLCSLLLILSYSLTYSLCVCVCISVYSPWVTVGSMRAPTVVGFGSRNVFIITSIQTTARSNGLASHFCNCLLLLLWFNPRHFPKNYSSFFRCWQPCWDHSSLHVTVLLLDRRAYCCCLRKKTAISLARRSSVVRQKGRVVRKIVVCTSSKENKV